MADRKAELERKKKRLEEIRAARSKKVTCSIVQFMNSKVFLRSIYYNYALLFKAGSSPIATKMPLSETTSSTFSDTSSTTNEIDNILKDFDLPSAPSG